jgi:hypothetical protein
MSCGGTESAPRAAVCITFEDAMEERMVSIMRAIDVSSLQEMLNTTGSSEEVFLASVFGVGNVTKGTAIRIAIRAE